MNKLVLLAITATICATEAVSQVNNIYANSGVAYTVGAPTFRPGARGSMVAIDTVTGKWWFSHDRNGAAWEQMGDRLQVIAGCSAPAYEPEKYQSQFVVNTCAAPELYYHAGGGAWDCLNCGSGGGGAVNTDATLDGDGSGGDLLRIAQQSAATSEMLAWTGATWEPSWGNPLVFVTTGQAITTDVNEVLIGTVSGDITLGLPTCDASTHEKRFKFVRNGTDSFSVTIDPGGSQTFYDGTTVKISYGKLSIDCTCRFSGGTGVWFFDNF